MKNLKLPQLINMHHEYTLSTSNPFAYHRPFIPVHSRRNIDFQMDASSKRKRKAKVNVRRLKSIPSSTSSRARKKSGTEYDDDILINDDGGQTIKRILLKKSPPPSKNHTGRSLQNQKGMMMKLKKKNKKKSEQAAMIVREIRRRTSLPDVVHVHRLLPTRLRGGIKL